MNKLKKQNPDQLVATALREYAKLLLDNKDTVSVEHAQTLDRALRSCKGITDIDIVWCRWRAYGEPLGWLTDHELKFNGKFGYFYVEKI